MDLLMSIVTVSYCWQSADDKIYCRTQYDFVLSALFYKFRELCDGEIVVKIML